MQACSSTKSQQNASGRGEPEPVEPIDDEADVLVEAEPVEAEPPTDPLPLPLLPPPFSWQEGGCSESRLQSSRSEQSASSST